MCHWTANVVTVYFKKKNLFSIEMLFPLIAMAHNECCLIQNIIFHYFLSQVNHFITVSQAPVLQCFPGSLLYILIASLFLI